MRVAVIGSRGLNVEDLGEYLPENVSEIVSGGARGVDACAKAYAAAHGLKLTEFLPEYAKYGRAAPLRRNAVIVGYADMVVALWDGKSRGTKYVVDYAAKVGKPCIVYVLPV